MTLRFPRRRPFIKLNHHSHTDASDGYTSALESLQLAQKHNLVLGITDHNTVASLEALQQLGGDDAALRLAVTKHILPGIELHAAEGVELLVYAPDIVTMIEFYQAVIHEKRNAFEPIQSRLQLSLLEIIRVCQARQLPMVIPHLHLRHYGLQALGQEQLEAIIHQLERTPELVAVEHNPFLSRWKNWQASLFARKHKWPIIAGADSHDSRHHRSYTRVRLNPKTHPTAFTVFAQVWQQFPKHKDRHLEPLSWTRTIWHGLQQAWQMGYRGWWRCAQREVGAWLS